MCWKCKSDINETEIYRSSVCKTCGADLHSCKNCKFYSPGSHYDCHETIEELVKDKERSNFCDSFSVKRTFSDIADATDKSQKARDAFAALFS